MRLRTGSHLYFQTPEARRLEYSRDVTLEPEPATDMRLYSLGPFFREQHGAVFDRTTRALDRLRRRMMTRMAAANALAAAAAGAVYVYLAWVIVNGQRPVGDLLLYGGAASLLQTHLTGLGASIGENFPVNLDFLPSLFRVLDAPPDLPLPVHPRPAPRPMRQGIVFEGVAFAYPNETKNERRTTKESSQVGPRKPSSFVVRPSSVPVLRDVSFTIRPGECVALVGHNGAGKTTIVKLLLRLYDPTAGRILLDGVDLREHDLDDLRRQMAVIFQDFVRYELTAGENIGLGQVEALYDRARLLGAAAKAGALELVQQLPQGLETPLGRELGGRELSGGEWQKLALARAFVRDCQVLVLDEPTAALDVQTEYDVYSRFHDLTRDRTTLLISHRFSTVRMADRILVLEGGRVRRIRQPRRAYRLWRALRRAL
ncbi:MAG: ATP-binding cassette domain-containing protein [Chloroflexi bacterium]|nr:ATP-binding cassette domain-containing protein [Chloroflexota bacterium]